MNDFRELLRTLLDARVEFILIGGVAATAYGASRLTEDVDVLYQRTPENIARLAAALAPIDPYLRGVPAGLPFRWDAQTIQRGMNFT